MRGSAGRCWRSWSGRPCGSLRWRLPTRRSRGLGVVMPYGLYYLLALVGHYLVSLPAAFALCRSVPRTPLAPCPSARARMGRWFVIGAALMWLCSLLGSSLNDLAYRLSGRARSIW